MITKEESTNVSNKLQKIKGYFKKVDQTFHPEKHQAEKEDEKKRDLKQAEKQQKALRILLDDVVPHNDKIIKDQQAKKQKFQEKTDKPRKELQNNMELEK